MDLNFEVIYDNTSINISNDGIVTDFAEYEDTDEILVAWIDKKNDKMNTEIAFRINNEIIEVQLRDDEREYSWLSLAELVKIKYDMTSLEEVSFKGSLISTRIKKRRTRIGETEIESFSFNSFGTIRKPKNQKISGTITFEDTVGTRHEFHFIWIKNMLEHVLELQETY